MKIRIGNQTAFSAPPLEPFEYAVANGFEAFEWLPDKKESGAGWDKDDISPETRGYIRATAASHDISLSVHGAWHLNSSGPDMCELLSRDISFASDIGAGLINIHLDIDRGIEAYVKAVMPIIALTAKAGIKLSIENTVFTGPDDFNRLFVLLRGLNIPAEHVGICLDIGHANLCASTRNDYLRFIDMLDPAAPIIHMHMHENYGDYDSHLPIFTGPSRGSDAGMSGLIDRLRKRDFFGSMILEQWPQPASLLNNARDRLLRIISKLQETKKPEDVAPRDFSDVIAEADARCRSWKEKLEWIRDFLKTADPDTEQLVYLAIYMRFIGTGRLDTCEDGRHFRPGHHSGIARDIEKGLGKIADRSNAFVMRKIYPWLPSYDSAFMRAEPLTRIRDIAHRNDIPQELKQEIKHTLQNKLHRCAGPEDLVTSAGILERITSPGASYSPAFVEEFRIFHEELKEFFNARSLDERLEAMVDKVNAGEAALVRKFLGSKNSSDTSPGQRMRTLSFLTELRERIVEIERTEEGAAAQQLRLADIGLEDFAFVLASEIINMLEAPSADYPEAKVFQAISLILRNVRLGGIEPEECSAAEAGLAAALNVYDPADRRRNLLLKAALDRCLRLSHEYTEKVLVLFPERVARLGKKLNVSADAVKFFAEGDIRGNLIFQLSKLVSQILKKVRTRAALPPWDVLVTGRTAGRLVEAERLTGGAEGPSGRVILLLDRVEGDEEIPRGVTGIILRHEIPHLSHLGVRARQCGVVFVVCGDEEQCCKLERLAGKVVELEATADVVKIQVSDSGPTTGITPVVRRPITIPDVVLDSELKLIELKDIKASTGGGKAYAAKQLEELSSGEGPGFGTPPGIVIPFGVMAEALRSRPEIENKYKNIIDGLNDPAGPGFLKDLENIRGLTLGLKVPDEIISGILKKFRHGERLMVRSSSNFEDLTDFAGAGLYDSVANVSPPEAADAVLRVWASLWTKRAVISRTNAGIPHEKAYMAVLIQEMLVPDYSFIMHTVNPVSLNKDEAYAELAVGLGEILASGAARGNPYRMVCNGNTGSVQMLAFANFSHALMPGKRELVRRTVDYSKAAFSTDTIFRNRLGRRLAAAGKFVERAFGGPQDIEGAIVGDEIYLVQSRPQQ